jgi:hypothetical protein
MSYRSFKGNTNYFDTKITKTIESNIVEFVNWGFVNQGAFVNVENPTSGAYGGDYSVLRRVTDPRYTAGTVYEAIRGNWVWESGLESNIEPIDISGVYVNNVLVTSGYNVDYIHGRVYFNTALNSSASVKIGYSYKEVMVVSDSEYPMLKTVQELSRRPDNTNFLSNSGVYIGLRDTKVQLPLVSVKALGRSNSGFQLGDGQIVQNTIKCYVIGENDYEVNQICDTLCDQESKNIRLFDINRMAQNNAFPLTYQGFLTDTPLCYPDLVQPSSVGGYLYNDPIQYGKARIVSSESQNGNWINGNIYQNTVTMVLESIVTNI